jgi:hypothetical protein
MFAHGLFVHQNFFNYALANLLFGLCRSVWIIVLVIICPSLIPEVQHAPLPPKCCEPESVPQLFILPMFSPLDLQLNLSKSLGVRHGHNECWFNPKIKFAKQPCYSKLIKIWYSKVYPSLLKDAWWHYYIAQNKMIEDKGGYMLHEYLCFVNWLLKCTKKWWFVYQLKWCNYQIQGLVHCFLQTPIVIHQHDGNASFSSPCWQEPTLRTWTFCDLEWFWAVIANLGFATLGGSSN